MNDMELLARAVGRVGSIHKLASHMGMSPKAVYAWKARKRLPVGWRAYLDEMLRDPNWPGRQLSGSV